MKRVRPERGAEQEQGPEVGMGKDIPENREKDGSRVSIFFQIKLIWKSFLNCFRCSNI